MPRKRNVGHPGQVEMPAGAGFYNDPADPDGTARVDGGGNTNSAFNGALTSPSYPITNATVEIITFSTPTDVDTGVDGVWTETKDNPGDQGLTQTNARGGGATYEAGANSETTIRRNVETVELGDGQVFAEVRFKFPAGNENASEFHFGFEGIDDPSQSFDVRLRINAATGDLEIAVKGAGDASFITALFLSQSSVSNVFNDDEFHTLSLHFEDFSGLFVDIGDGNTIQSNQELYIFVDNQLHGTAMGFDNDGEEYDRGGYTSPTGTLAVKISTLGAGGGGSVTTEVNRIVIVQDD